jgi:hypothetical protein
MMPKAHITKAEISKLTEAIEHIICIRGGGGGLSYLKLDHDCFLLRRFQFIVRYYSIIQV